MPGGLRPGGLMLARFLAALGHACLSGVFVAVFVAFRPQWLATHADRVCRVPKPGPDS